MTIRGKKISPISNLHFIKLFYRSALFLWAVGVYLYSWLKDGSGIFQGIENKYWLLGAIWVVYAVEMALRFFPSKLESMGCQKQFSHNYAPTGEKVTALYSWKSTLVVGLVWILLNGIIGGLYFLHLLYLQCTADFLSSIYTQPCHLYPWHPLPVRGQAPWAKPL